MTWLTLTIALLTLPRIDDAQSVQFFGLNLRNVPPGCLNWSTTLCIFINAFGGFWMVTS